MTDKDDSTPSEIQDGFDLIEYPIDYNFKAMCRAEKGVSAIDYITGLIVPMLNDGALVKISGNISRTGKFESVTAIVHINNREELESIYKLIAQSDRVVMTL
jgi:putative lipoic acid-binding regulatory protein